VEIVVSAGNLLRPSSSYPTNTMETKFVTVYWSEITHRKTTIEVDKDETDEEYMLDIAFQSNSRICGNEIELDSIEFVQGLDLENE